MNTINLKETIKLTSWMEVNHDKLVSEKLTRNQAVKKFAADTGISVSPGRMSNQAQAMEWIDWPSRGSREDNNKKRPTKNVRVIAATLRDLLYWANGITEDLETDSVNNWDTHLKNMREIAQSIKTNE